MKECKDPITMFKNLLLLIQRGVKYGTGIHGGEAASCPSGVESPRWSLSTADRPPGVPL